MFTLLTDTLTYVGNTLVHNFWSLALGVTVASLMQVYINPEKLKAALTKRSYVSIPGSVAFGAFTPFCACGTMAIVVSMLTTALPWGPIMAFIVSSPLMSPDEFVMFSGIIGSQFAIALTAASILLGLGAGYITHFLEKRTHFMDDQARFAEPSKESSCGCSSPQLVTCCSGVNLPSGSGAGVCCVPVDYVQESTLLTKLSTLIGDLRLGELATAFVDIGLRKVLPYFAIFAAVGFLINRFVPSSLIMSLFSAHNIFAVPLAAIVGLPLYVSGASSIPLIKVLLAGGASSGAMLAFMITGPGTSAGAIAGIMTIMKKRAVGLYIAYLLAGSIILGYLYDLIQTLYH